MSHDLEPLAPAEAVEMYLAGRQDDATPKTLEGQASRLRAFVQWCEETGLENLNDLTGRSLYEYRIWRREGQGEDRGPVKKVTLKSQLSTLRVFLKWCATVEAVPADLHDKVPLPVLEGDEDVSDSTLEPERALHIIDYLGRYHYASRDHVIWLLGWQTGARTSGLLALDLDDCDLDGTHPQLDGPAVHFVHRPTTDTRLKNGEKSERWNRLSQHTANVLADYIDGPRIAATDEHGRAPLLTTTHGRPHPSTIRDAFYRWTRPCFVGEACPHERDVETCEATSKDHASSCPSARSPHDMRSGRVTFHAREDVPRAVVSERMDASEEVLGKHYDRRSLREQAEQRSKYLSDL